VDLAVNLGPNGGAVAVNLFRHVLDSKTPAGQDQPFAVVMDGCRISGATGYLFWKLSKYL